MAQRDEHYVAQIEELHEQIESLREENTELRTAVSGLEAQASLARQLQEDTKRARMELLGCISEKERALQQCRGASYPDPNSCTTLTPLSWQPISV